MAKDHYRADQKDPEYLDNWVNKMDLLCKPQSEIGFLGSCFFIGIIISIAFVPKLSDQSGRLMILRVALALQVIAQFGIYVTKSLSFAFFMMVLLGMTHSAKNIVGLNHILEMVPMEADKNPKRILDSGFIPIKYIISQNSVNFFLTVESSYIIVIAFTYQFLDNSWWLLQTVSLIAIAILFLFSVFWICESPKFYYSKGRFEESR